MSQAVIALESQQIAQELYAIIKKLESSSWRAELESIQERLHQLGARLRRAIDAFDRADDQDSAAQQLLQRLRALYTLIEEARPRLDSKAMKFKSAWRAYRKKLVPEYEALAASLKMQDIHLTNLRPTNYSRNVFHVSSAVMVLLLIEVFMTSTQLSWLAGSVAALGWIMELSRRHSARVNAMLMWVLGPIAHPHERHRINSSTWYTTALLILSLTVGPMLGALAVIILGTADPAAAIIGRKFGRTKLLADRTLEGTLAFVTTGLVASLVVMAIFHPTLTALQMLVIAAVASSAGAIAELYSKRIDDNFSIPLAVAAAGALASLAVGVPV
ncbi:MAG: phosphatidate cytidylyltransferase [Myxococcota bacterium]